MHIKSVLDNAKIYPPAVLSIKLDDVIAAFKRSAENLTAVSLATGFATKASVHHVIINAFKNLACASYASGFTFKQAEALKNSAGSSAPATAAPAKVAPVVAPKKEESK